LWQVKYTDIVFVNTVCLLLLLPVIAPYVAE